MPYHYDAAPGYRAHRRQPSQGSSTYAYSAAGSSLATSQSSTSERWHAVQGPAIHMSPATSTKEVRFVAPNDPSSPYLYPGRPTRTAGSPMSTDNMYIYSPNTPSLSHTPDADDFMECPGTPLLKPRSLEPEDEPSLFSPNSSTYASYYEIDCVLYELNSLTRSYHYPTELDFEPAQSTTEPIPRLAYTAKNRPFLEHNQKLEKLQTRLDAIQSNGDEALRKARKAAGAQVQRTIEELQRVPPMIWRQWVRSQRNQRQV